VAHLITRLELGGAQGNTLHTVGHLDPDRFEPLLACGAGGMLDREAGELGLAVEFVPHLVREIDPARDLAALAGLTRLWRRARPQVVHTHSSKAGVLGRISAHLAGVPVVVHTVHGFGFHPEQGHAERGLFEALERLVAPLTTHFIVVSSANRDQGEALGLFRHGNVSLVRSGIDLARFREARRDRERIARELQIPPDVPLVGMVACLKPQKAPLDFVEVARRIAERVPAAHFVLVGDGELRPQVEAARRAAGLETRLHLPGWRRDVEHLLKGFDLMVHTARWEGLPRVLPEALAAGCPIVATAVDGAPDLIRDGENGRLVPAGDVAGLAAAAIALLEDPEARGRLVPAAWDGDGFDIDQMVREQERLYLALWRASRGAGGEACLAGA
jgi:glycosyltransferase involved in cell wall biosynthesis